ncbi:MAG: hypothetical protein RLZZ399_2100 [Verrucomicrobiota bacterium]
MGLLRRFLGKLFDPPASSLDDIVFERLDDPQEPSKSVGGVQVSMEELIPSIPLIWLRSGDWSVQRTLWIPPEAFLETTPERPAVVSLRFLARSHPDLFRDPGPMHPDTGVDLPINPIRDSESRNTEFSAELPPEVVLQTALDRSTFSEWENEERPADARSQESQETSKALRGVRMPAVPPKERGTPFEKKLEVQKVQPSPTGAPALTSNRARRILQAYASGLPASAEELAEVDLPPLRPPTGEIRPAGLGLPLEQALGQKRGAEEEALLAEVNRLSRAEKSLETWNPPAVPKAAEPVAEPNLSEPYRMRFEELGLSLSRFPEVKGFALWQGGYASHTGDLGFDLELTSLHPRLERMLQGAIQVQGVQDGFLSVTVSHSKGGLSVFGSGSSMVAVAHQHEGLPGHLRAWMCGWVSQPLRG